MIDLDEMREKWAEHDRKLDTSIRLNRQILKTLQVNKARWALRRMAVILILGAIATLAVIVPLGAFIYANISEPRFALPAAALDLIAIAILAAQIAQAAIALEIDYSRPVAAIQKRLETLRIVRIRYIQGIFLAAALVWTPLLIVSFKGFFGLDAYSLFPGAWLAGNALFGLAVIPLIIWLFSKFGSDRVMDNLAGYNLKAARGFLATLSEFEDEQA